MMHFYNDETPAEWVMGQIDTTEIRTIFGIAHETQGISHVRFINGVDGLLMTGLGPSPAPANRLLGSEGVIRSRPASGRFRAPLQRADDWLAECGPGRFAP